MVSINSLPPRIYVNGLRLFTLGGLCPIGLDLHLLHLAGQRKVCSHLEMPTYPVFSQPPNPFLHGLYQRAHYQNMEMSSGATKMSGDHDLDFPY